MFAGWPDGLREALVERHVFAGWWQAGVRERSNMPEIADELKGGGDLPDVPVIVLAATGIDPGMRLLMSGKSPARNGRRQPPPLRRPGGFGHAG
jgi:hypothetical protein